MMDTTKLHALADGELDPQEAHALRESLKTEPRASAELDAILNLKDVLAKSSVRHTDDEAWKGCLRRLDAIDRTQRVEGFIGRYAWALCGVMFVFILSGRFAMRNVQGDTARTADVARIFGGGSAAPVSAQTRAEAKLYESLLSQVGKSLDRKEVEIGQPTYGLFHDMPAVQIPMRDGSGDLVLTRFDGLLNVQDTTTLPTSPNLSAGVLNGENCLVWQSGGRTWLLGGDRDLEALADVAYRLFGVR